MAGRLAMAPRFTYNPNPSAAAAGRWAAADVALVGSSLRSGKSHALARRREGKFAPAFDLQAWRRQMTAESYRPEHVLPLSARLPFHYHILPGWVRNALASALLPLARSRGGGFPAQLHDYGPLLISLLLNDSNGRGGPPVAVLTHDIDTAAGLQWVKVIAEVERAIGARACWNVVPRHYRLDYGQLDWLVEAGHEIGLHGIWHTNREAFLPGDEFRHELDRLAALRSRFAISGLSRSVVVPHAGDVRRARGLFRCRLDHARH